MELPLPDDVNIILRRLEGCGNAAFLVGGCVRDLRMGRTPHDWDICTSAEPDAIAACFSDCRTIATGLQHGTLTVVLHDAPYEITTFRHDGAYSDHRRPDSVTYTPNLIEDLRRRDFTINAMAYHPDKGFVDPFHGEVDLQDGRIRCVGDPDERFSEDALRILRALRFASALGFCIDRKTERSIRHNAHLLQWISQERIASELNKLLLGQNAQAVLSDYADVLGVPIPEILPCVGFDQRSKYHHLTVWEHTCLCIQNAIPDLTVRLALLLHDLAKPACFVFGADGFGHFYGHPEAGAKLADTILRRLRYDAKTLEIVTILVREHDAVLTPTKASALRWLNRIGPDTLQLLLHVKRADASAHRNPAAGLRSIQAFEAALSQALESDDCFTLHTLAIGGQDILELHVPEGPAVGKILSQLLDEVIDGALPNDACALLTRAKTLANELSTESDRISSRF